MRGFVTGLSVQVRTNTAKIKNVREPVPAVYSSTVDIVDCVHGTFTRTANKLNQERLRVLIQHERDPQQQ